MRERLELTVADFEAAGLSSQLESIEAAVATHLEGSDANVAVVAEPYAGRDVLLSYAEEHLGAAAGHVAFESPVTDPDELAFPNREVVVVEGCHYLYQRRIGGFDVLDAFLDHIAESDAMFVTAWNRWAWDYLAAVKDVDRTFSEQVPVPRLSTEAITELVQGHVDELPAFVETDEHGRVKTFDVSRKTVGPVGDVELSVPVPELNLEYLTARDLDDEEYGETERVVYERLTRLAEGNPGVALALWDRAVADGEISPTHLDSADEHVDLTDDDGLVLTAILCKERISREMLSVLIDDVNVTQSVQTLANQGLVHVTDDVVSVAPERFHAAVEHLEGRRLLW